MKVLGYYFCALGAVVGALLVFDNYFLEAAEQIWNVLNYVICASLVVCVVLGIRHHMAEGTDAIAPGVLLSIFAFLVFTESWLAYMGGSDMPTTWMWADAIAVIALVRVGTRLLAKE